MVDRSDKRLRFARWCNFFAKDRQAQDYKHTLRDIVEGGKAKVILRDISQYMVELVWSKAVTFDSAARLVRFAKEEQTCFEIPGEPRGIAEDVDEAAAAALTWGCG